SHRATINCIDLKSSSAFAVDRLGSPHACVKCCLVGNRRESAYRFAGEELYPVNLLTLHRAPDRRSYFAAQARPFFFDDTLHCFVVADPRLAEECLQHASLATVDYAEAYQRLEDQFGTPFPNFLYAFRHIPICLNDDNHRDARRRVAETIAARRAALATTIPLAVQRRLGLLSSFDRVDLMGQVLVPLVDDVMATLIETESSTINRFRGVPGIFDRMIGLRRRKALEAELGAAREAIGIEKDVHGALLTLLS